MKTRIGMGLVFAVFALISTGCMENATLVSINKDGSGTVTYRMFLSEQLTGMMSGMAGTMAAFAGDTNAPPREVDPLSDVKRSLEGQFGPNVKLVSSRDVTNDAGWKGVEAVYEFENIGAIRFDKQTPMDAGPAGPAIEQVATDYAFEFIEGDVSTVVLKPTSTEGRDVGPIGEEPTEQTHAGDQTSDASAEEPTAVEGRAGLDGVTDGMLDGMGLQMMAPLLKGMRVAVQLSVNGEIVETNAKYRSDKKDNMVTLVDIAFDRVLNDPAGAKLLQTARPMDAARLAELEVPGLMLEQPDKELRIKFK